MPIAFVQKSTEFSTQVAGHVTGRMYIDWILASPAPIGPLSAHSAPIGPLSAHSAPIGPLSAHIAPTSPVFRADDAPELDGRY